MYELLSGRDDSKFRFLCCAKYVLFSLATIMRENAERQYNMMKDVICRRLHREYFGLPYELYM